MKKSLITLIKNCFLFYILFDFFSLAVSFFFSSLSMVLSDIRILDLSFYRLQPVYFQILFSAMNLYILALVAFRYFRLLLSFINADEKENDYFDKEIELEILYKKKILNKRIMFIVICLTFSIIFSVIIRFLEMFNRY